MLGDFLIPTLYRLMCNIDNPQLSTTFTCQMVSCLLSYEFRFCYFRYPKHKAAEKKTNES